MTQLHHASPPANPTAQVRGACPTLREPMQTGDGLLARLRPVGGVISPSQLWAIAALAERFGNGQIEVTARGNLQVRGLQAETIGAFAEAIEAVVAIESGLPIEVSPLAGLDPGEIIDPRPLASAIGASASSLEARLGPKVTVVIDGGDSVSRGDLSADIRLTAVRAADGPIWALEIGGNSIGLLRSDEAAGVAWAALSLIAEIGLHGRGRDLDAAAMRQALAPFIVAEPFDLSLDRSAPARIELADGRIAVLVSLPFGAAGTVTLSGLAEAAKAMGISEFRLAPYHGLVAICGSDAVAAEFQQAAVGFGLVITAVDPRRAISACIGSDGCASGAIAARRVAEMLAQAEPEFLDGSFALHVSGCAKGCAHPRPAQLTLVGNGTGVDLVIDGSAKSVPMLRLAGDAVQPAVQRLAALWRGERKLGESVGACFKRLGAETIAAAVRQGWQ